MIFNSQICTTREQSERLIALGLKKGTADMQFVYSDSFMDGVIILPHPPDEEGDIPAWSLHRLIEIVAQTQYPYYVISKELPIYDALCERIEWLIEDNRFNKEYLEEKK